jgi:hypothetical protein
MSKYIAIVLLGTTALAGCSAAGSAVASGGPSPSTSAEVAATPSGSGALGGKASPTPAHSAKPTSTGTTKKTTGTTDKSSGPRIVSFKVVQKPKCAEGTAVFRAAAVPLIIEWTIAGATGGALSVDDPTNTPGTYGSVDLHGSQAFPFSCAGNVGTTETHTFALYTVGGGAQKKFTIKASAKVLDKGATPPAGS